METKCLHHSEVDRTTSVQVRQGITVLVAANGGEFIFRLQNLGIQQIPVTNEAAQLQLKREVA